MKQPKAKKQPKEKQPKPKLTKEEKKALRAAKREAKRARGRDYYLPADQAMSGKGVVIGYCLRALLAGLLSGALSTFLCDSFDIIALPKGFVYLFALVLSGIFAMMTFSKRLMWVGIGVLTLGTVGGILLTGDPVGLVVGIFPNAWNTAMRALENAGFQSLNYMRVSGSLTGVELQTAFQLLMAAVYTFLIFVSTFKKVYLLPVAIGALFSMLPVFTYNFAYSTLEFSIIIFTMAAILVIRYYDRAIAGVKCDNESRKAAYGGYIGIGAAMLAAVAVLVPAMTVKAEWDEIDGIADRMEVARTVLSAVLVGEKPDWTQMDNMGNMDSLGSRDTIATHRQYTGREVLKVHSGINLTMYLRSWISHDYNDQRWTAASDRTREEYANLFGEDFMPEQVSQNFLEIALPATAEFNLSSDYKDYSKYGFVTAVVSVEVINSTGNLLYVPARFDIERGFMVHKSDAENFGKPYAQYTANYYDGIVSTSWLNNNKKYSTVSYLPRYEGDEVAQNLQSLLRVYEQNVLHMTVFHAQTKQNRSYTLQEYLQDAKDPFYSDVDYTAFYNFTEKSYSARQAYLEQITEENARYTDYVYEHYMQKLGGGNIDAIAQQIVKDAGLPEHLFYEVLNSGSAYPTQMGTLTEKFEAVMAVVDYLTSDEFTYTLTPAEPSAAILNRGMDAVEIFLLSTKEGYCVQYATAATFLLREMGIPTRYVEGYIVERLEYDENVGERFEKYQTTVRDFNAHAWIECYFDDIGWMTFEVTPPYYEVIYVPTVQVPTVPPYTPPEPEPTPEPPITPPVEPTEPTVPLIFGFIPVPVAIGVGVSLGATAVIVTIALLIRAYFKKKKRLRDLRQGKVEKALSGDLSQEEIDELGAYVADLVEKTCLAGGLRRDKFEFPTDFAARIDEALASLKKAPVLRASFVEIVPILEQVHFAKTLSREDLTLLAEFWISLRDRTVERFNLFEKYWYGTVRLMV